jgi:hypothetical protein
MACNTKISHTALIKTDNAEKLTSCLYIRTKEVRNENKIRGRIETHTYKAIKIISE